MADGSNQIPAGWYADPQNPNQHRYWDGSSWTDHTQPVVDPPPPPAATPSWPTSAPPASQPFGAMPPGAPPLGGPPPAPQPRSGMPTAVKVLLVLGALSIVLVGGCTALLVTASRSLEEAADQFDDAQPVRPDDALDQAVETADDLLDEALDEAAQAAGDQGLGTREEPLPFSQAIELAWDTFGDADGSRWATTIGPHTDITEAVLAENTFNEAPPEGVRFVGFEVEMTLVSADKEPLSPGFNFTWEVLGGATNAAYDIGTIETESFGCGVVADAFDDFAEVFVGGTLTGTVCIPVPAEDLTDPATRVAIHFVDDTRAIFGGP